MEVALRKGSPYAARLKTGNAKWMKRLPVRIDYDEFWMYTLVYVT
jgi:hypothetical protein